MDLIKKLTGKNPSEYEPIAKSLVDNSDTELFKKLVQQDDFLFDFIKSNVAKRIQHACNKDNYLNLMNFMDIYSPSYETVIAEVLHNFGGESLYEKMKNLFLNGSDSQKAYSAKFFSFVDENYVKSFADNIREASLSEYEPLVINSIELLSNINDEKSKANAISKLDSDDEFEQYNGVKFLVNYGAKDCVKKLIDVMKKSSFSENIAYEIPYLISVRELLETDYEGGLLVLCNIVNSIPDIILPSAVCDYELKEVFEEIIRKGIDSASAVLLRLAYDKFNELTSNEEYLFDCDKNTKDEVKAITDVLNKLNPRKLNSLLYDELYDESDFVFYALDFVDEIEELETLLESNNQTLILKVLTLIKEKNALKQTHKDEALRHITNPDIKNIVLAI